MRKLNSRGFSLIAALVAISIVGVIVLTVTNLIGVSADVLNTFNNAIRAMDAAQEVRFALTDANTCTLNFSGIDLSATTHTSQVKLNRELTYPEATDKTKLSTRPVVLIDNSDGEQMRLDGIFLRRSAASNLAYVEVRLGKKDAPAGAASTHARALPLWVQTDAGGRIVCCTTLNMNACP